MKKSILFAAFAALTMVFTTSCENDDDFSYNGSNSSSYGKSAELSLNVDVDGYNATRAASIVTGWASLTNPAIGVSVYKGTAATSGLYANSRANTEYKYSGGLWNTTAAPSLYAASGYVTAYYPYVADADPTALGITVDNKTDVMYVPLGASVVSVNKPQAQLTMRHALARIGFTLSKSGYTGSGYVSYFTVESKGVAKQGTFNSVTGEWSETSTNTLTDYYANRPIESPSKDDLFVIPASSGTEQVKLSFVIDAATYSITTTAKIEKGKVYVFPVTVTDKGLSVSNVSITDWEPATGTAGGTVQPE